MSQRSFILLFRGINVGGNKIVRMELLRKVLTEAGFGNVASYIQSGTSCSPQTWTKAPSWPAWS